MKALSRQSRDLIALAIKCFSANTYFINSKIISNVSSSISSEKSQKEEKVTSMSDLLLELEFLKKELYSTRSKLLYGPKDKLIYVATFTKNGILIRPKRVYIRKTKSCAINRILQNIKRFVTMIFRVIKH